MSSKDEYITRISVKKKTNQKNALKGESDFIMFHLHSNVLATNYSTPKSQQKYVPHLTRWFT